MTRLSALLLVPIILLASHGNAQETSGKEDVDSSLPSRVTVDAGQSSSDSKSLFIDSDIGLSNEGRLLVGLGASRFSGSAGVLQTNSVRAGYQTDPLEEWSFGGSFENWGAAQKLTSNSFRGSVVWSPAVWELSAEPEFKIYNWFVPAQNNRKLRANGSALHMRLGYYGVKNLSLSLSFSGYSYSERMDTILDSGYFYEEAMDLAAGFPKSYLGLNASYRFNWLTVGTGYSVTRYQFVDGDSKTSTLKLSADIQKTWAISVEVGTSQSEGSKSNFSSLAVTYNW